MLTIWPYALLLSLLRPTRAQQQVLQDEGREYPRLNFSSSSPLIFHSIFGLLQQWPNTFFDYGHTIASCTIPKNTNLYHASRNSDPLPNPEWFAFDPQMAYAILGVLPNSHLHTFRTQREVQALYFDRSSASLWHDGNMDSQMNFIYNASSNIPEKPILKLPPEWRNLTGNGTFYDGIAVEYVRAAGLCNFIHERGLGGLGWGYEGVVRMNAGFEMIWCNFTSPSIKLISWLNVSAPPLDDWPPFTRNRYFANALELHLKALEKPRRGLPVDSNPFIFPAISAWYSAASKRYGFGDGAYGSGETRVKLDSCGLFTYYDPKLRDQETARIRSERRVLNLTINGSWCSPNDTNDRSAALKKLSRRRREHRAVNVSMPDGLYMRHAVEKRMRATLTPEENHPCSGIDWVNLAREIVTSHSIDLYMLSKLFGRCGDTADHSLPNWIARVRNTAHGLYMPFYEYPRFTLETIRSDFGVSAPQSRAALARCQTQNDPLDVGSLSEGETLTFAAIFDVLSAICNTMLPIFLSTERLWLQGFNNASESAPLPPSDLLAEVRSTNLRNTRALEELMAWLGWEDQWTACEPGCGIGQTCYLPMWPIMAIPGQLDNRTDHDPLDDLEELFRQYVWNPKCIDIEDVVPS